MSYKKWLLVLLWNVCSFLHCMESIHQEIEDQRPIFWVEPDDKMEPFTLKIQYYDKEETKYGGQTKQVICWPNVRTHIGFVEDIDTFSIDEKALISGQDWTDDVLSYLVRALSLATDDVHEKHQESHDYGTRKMMKYVTVKGWPAYAAELLFHDISPTRINKLVNIESLSDENLSDEIKEDSTKKVREEDLINYPEVQKMIPSMYVPALLNYLNGSYTLTQKDVDLTLEEAERDEQKRKRLVWGAVAFAHGLFSNKQGSAAVISGDRLFKGQRASPEGELFATLMIQHWVNMPEKEADEIQKKDEVLTSLLQDYKIHSMPKGNMVKDLSEFLTFITKNPKLQKLIYCIKLIYNYNDKALLEENDNAKISPKFVIYVATNKGKQNTQTLLNALYGAFWAEEGLNVCPRFNEPVTTSWYVAQGNGDDKKGNWREYFEQPNMIYFDKNHSEFIKYYQRNNIDVAKLNFHLINPNKNLPQIEQKIETPPTPRKSDVTIFAGGEVTHGKFQPLALELKPLTTTTPSIVSQSTPGTPPPTVKEVESENTPSPKTETSSNSWGIWDILSAIGNFFSFPFRWLYNYFSGSGQ